jgi:Zn-dependent peptidase ImmA (M78 family)
MWRELESAREINSRVDRLLRVADAYGRFPTPVEDIIRAAELTEADDYVLDESLIKKAPAYLRTLLRSAKQKIQGLVDRRARVVHVSPAIENEGKKRFVRMHETVHHILPHLLYADDHETLLRTTNRLFEREANQGAAELLFQREHFARDAADLEISTATVSLLANRYGWECQLQLAPL